MAEQQINTMTMDNGLVLLGERMDWVESAAFCLLLPAGCRFDPPGKEGLSNLLSDMVQRGAGPRDTRQLLTDLENMGVDYGASVSNPHLTFAAASLSERLTPALEIFADMVLRPHLPADQLEDSRQVCHQELRSLEDEHTRQVLLDLRRRHFPDPYGRSQFGQAESLDAIQWTDVQSHWKRHFVPEGAILGVAGAFDWDQLQRDVSRFFSEWEGVASQPPQAVAPPRGYRHLPAETSQTQIAIAYPTVPVDHDDFYRAWATMSILGDGETSRLFTKLREERGLVYGCGASYSAIESEGSVQCYAGTTSQRAQESMDVLMEQVQSLAEGVTDDELLPLKSRCKTALVMQQESSRARSGSIAHHWHSLGRVRPLAETQAAIDALTVDSINQYLRDNPPSSFTISTLGEQPLETPVELS